MSSTDAFDRVVARERAHHRSRRWRYARRCLTIHAWIFLAVNVALVAAWLAGLAVTGGDQPAWWVSTTVGWGVGLAVHALFVFRPWRRRHHHRPA